MTMNPAIARRLDEIASMIELLGGETFRAVSHRRAARTIEGLTTDVGTLSRDQLLQIEGIGPKIADKVVEFARTGVMSEHDALRAQVPQGVMDLLKVSGLGPKTARAMWTEAGVTSLAELHAAINDGRLLKLPRMGQKSIDKIKAALAFVESSGQRLNIGLALPLAERIASSLRGLTGVERVEYAGSLRRGRETVGDIDILVALKPGSSTDAAAKISAAFRGMTGVVHVLASGDTKSSVRLAVNANLGRWDAADQAKRDPESQRALAEAAASGSVQEPVESIQVDLRVIPSPGFGAALMYFTGSKEHNVAMRSRFLARGLTLNEYGLFPNDDEDTPPQARGIKPVAAATEHEIYAALELPYIPPELRENLGELDLRQTPELISVEAIRAELHAHTTASDGVLAIEELAARAKQRGFHTIAVTDHSRSSVLAGGLTIERLMTHVENVRRAASKAKGITILAGSEVDILVDGTLDYPDDVLRELDIVVASPHASLAQSPEAATSRLLAAIRNPYVDILGHPTGRIIGRRAGLAPDLTQLYAEARRQGVALEVNAHFMRLDLRDLHVRGAVESGCLVAIDCDVHEPADFDNLRFGVTTARRGGLLASSCVNTWDAPKLREWLGRRRSRALA
ncbi:MAG: helix-hairpin-helix domain-containing protein [Planctomycetota bacterium]|nr:helix-hairpin-helix domain-containing protein [Planctomycetota bacterium]